MGGFGGCWLRVERVGLRRVVGVFRNCVWLVNSRSSSPARFRTGLVPLLLPLVVGGMAWLPLVDVCRLPLAGGVPSGAAVFSSGAINFPLIFVVAVGGDGGVCLWHGRFVMCRGGG